MSWLFSKALMEACENSRCSLEPAAESSEATCSDGEQYAQLNVMPTAHPFSRRGKPMDALSLSRSGLTCAVLTESHGKELLTSYLADFHALTSASPVRVPVSTEVNLDSGESLPESWAKYDLVKSSWKTVQCSLLEDSAEFSGIWPASGSMRNGVCSALPTLDSRTCENASGYALPTPSGVNGGRNNVMGRIDEWGGSSNPLRGTVIGSMCLPEFEELMMGWPIGWTEPTPYEMDKFREWQQQHGGF